MHHNTYRARLRKQATAGEFLAAFTDSAATAADFGITAATMLLATAAAVGTGLGWVGAQATAHGPQDADALRMGYENERLRSDIGYLKARVEQEHESSKNRSAQQGARVLGY